MPEDKRTNRWDAVIELIRGSEQTTRNKALKTIATGFFLIMAATAWSLVAPNKKLDLKLPQGYRVEVEGKEYFLVYPKDVHELVEVVEYKEVHKGGGVALIPFKRLEKRTKTVSERIKLPSAVTKEEANKYIREKVRELEELRKKVVDNEPETADDLPFVLDVK